jgi:putative ABC transport system permease protein
MVNEKVARQFFAGSDPIGKRFLLGHPTSARAPEWITIVGVVGDTKLYGLQNVARLEVYFPFHQRVSKSMSLVVKSAIDPAILTSEIRGAITSVDKDQPIFAVAMMKQLVEDSVSIQRITFFVLGTFSALALILAAVGIYGVIAYAVTQRRREIGIRFALGARPDQVLRLVLGQGAKLAGAGVLVGICGLSRPDAIDGEPPVLGLLH